MNKGELKRLIERGILPLTSCCNVACLFCSHRYNPPGIETRRIPPLELGTIEEVFDQIKWSALNRLVIGESVTTTVEGEPLTHPHFVSVMRSLRTRAAHLFIRVTTNGTLLTETLLRELKSLGLIELTISLNAVSQPARQQLMGKGAGDILPMLKLLAEARLPWQASMVAMPHVTGLAEVKATLRAALEFEASCVRVFLPGFTRLTPESHRLTAQAKDELQEVLQEFASETGLPVVLEPAVLRNLRAELVGVLPGSAAHMAGLRTGDVIVSVAGEKALSRQDAFELILPESEVELTVDRDGRQFTCLIQKDAGATGGVVMYQDLPGRTIARLRRLAKKERGRGVVILTSELAAPLLQACLPLDAFANIRVEVVKNQVFGGSIACAGLLTVEDFASALGRITDLRQSLVLLPKAPFNEDGYDLVGRSWRELKSNDYRIQIM